jgi:hypothetical protein
MDAEQFDRFACHFRAVNVVFWHEFVSSPTSIIRIASGLSRCQINFDEFFSVPQAVTQSQ